MQGIRVRAWNTKSKEMFSPETMAEDQLTLLPTGQFVNVHSGNTRLSIIYPLDTMIPMLSTGLYDRNGVEIFKGDVVNVKFTNRDLGGVEELKSKPVIWSENNCAFAVDNGEWHEGLDGIVEIEVIGNCFEQPELLGEAA